MTEKVLGPVVSEETPLSDCVDTWGYFADPIFDHPYESDLGIFEDYDGFESDDYEVDEEYELEMDRVDEAFEEERRLELSRPNYQEMRIAEEKAAEQEMTSEVPNLLAERLFAAFTKNR